MILIAGFYTKSASGLVGIVFGIILMIMFLTRSKKKLISFNDYLDHIGNIHYINIRLVNGLISI